MKEYWITYKMPSDCKSCPPDEFEFLIHETDKLLMYDEDGKPVIYNNWVELLDSLPTDNVEIKEA